MLRSTDHDCAMNGYAVSLNLSHLKQREVELFYSWVEIWLFHHCKSGWKMNIEGESEDRKTQLSVVFTDVREALYFKLSPEYMKGQSSPISYLSFLSCSK